MWGLGHGKKSPVTCYEMNCSQCDFQEIVELRNPDFDSVCKEEFAHLVDVLPETCPTCGGKLRSRRLKIPIFDV